MKKIYFLTSGLTLICAGLFAQPCATTVATGSSSNAFTNIRNATNAIAVDNDVNTVIFVHRNNAGGFGGHSGQLRYDISNDNGTTWTNNQGVLNPLSVNGTNGARYPQVAIYNPAGNTNPSNAYLSYQAATVAAAFNGIVSGVRQLNGTGNTETYNQPASTQTLIPNSMVKGAPGVFWSVDAVYNGSATTGFRIFKGVWNGSSDVVWSTNATLTPPFNTSFNGVAQLGDFHIAFDPTGQIGWVSILTHLTGGPTPYSFYPVFYKTTDGGNTWSAPIQVDLGQFNCITSNIDPGNYASTAFESDLVVDVNGEPHLFTTVCNGNNAYAVFFTSWHHMFDITYHFGLWNAIDVANVNAGRGSFGTAPNNATMDNAPMASRTDDGTKVFFAWSDNSTYTTGAGNLTPNLFSKAYDVTTAMWTNVRDFTSCNVATNGSVFFPKMAERVIEPVSGQYQLAVISAITMTDPILTANFRFLNNMTWSNADFTTPQPWASVTVDQGSTWLLCPGSTLGLSVTGSFNQVLWSNGAITLTTTISAPGIYTVAVRSGCTVGIDTITVIGVSDTITAASSAICPGDSTLLTVSGNALSYSWSPVSSTNDSLMVQPSSTTTYTLTAGGDGGCTYNLTTSITVHPQSILSSSATSSTICQGDSSVLAVSGASTYTWQPGNISGNSITVTPTVTSTYSVTGTDANGCLAVDSVTVNVNALPVVAAVADTTVLCNGDTATLTASGANSYSWTPSASLGSPSAATTSAYPTTQTNYIVMGTDVNGCMNYDTISVSVNALPVVTATTSGTLCENDTAFFTATGASSYLWMPLNVTGDSVYAFPSVGQNNYYVTGTDSNGCSATDSFIVLINPLPVLVTNGQSPICAGSPAILAVSGGASSFLWLPSNATSNPITVTPATTTTYTVIGTDPAGCSATDSFTVVVNPLPVVTLSIASSAVCLDDASVSLSGTGSPAGGTFSGNGVAGNSFTPGAAGVGSQTVSYVYVDNNGCTDTATDVIIVNACVGINEAGSVISTIYPNPFGGQVTLETTGTGETQVIVHSMLGQEIMNTEFTGNKLVIETASWPAGVYLFTINTANGQQTARLIKQ